MASLIIFMHYIYLLRHLPQNTIKKQSWTLEATLYYPWCYTWSLTVQFLAYGENFHLTDELRTT